jgi:nitroreductase
MIKRIIRAALRPRGVRALSQVLHRIRIAWFAVAVRSSFLSRLHYLFFSNTFEREARAVIAGHLAFEVNKNNTEPMNYFLRRCIHRLEKGLTMRPRRPVFATDYIEDAVDSYVDGFANLNCSEATWAHDVLSDYFAIVGGDPSIEEARVRFEEFSSHKKTPAFGASPDCPSRPRLRDFSAPSPVTFDALRELSLRRRSIRWFEQRAVPRSLIDGAIEVAAMAPSACNRQPFKYRVYDDPEMVRHVAQLPMGIKGYEHNIPVLAAIIGRLRACPHPRDRHVIYIDASLSAMSLMYALETVGLSSCPINWPDIPQLEQAAQKLLGLAADERPIMFMAIGYPDPEARVPVSSKIAVPELRSYNVLHEQGLNGVR